MRHKASICPFWVVCYNAQVCVKVGVPHLDTTAQSTVRYPSVWRSLVVRETLDTAAQTTGYPRC